MCVYVYSIVSIHKRDQRKPDPLKFPFTCLYECTFGPDHGGHIVSRTDPLTRRLARIYFLEISQAQSEMVEMNCTLPCSCLQPNTQAVGMYFLNQFIQSKSS